jgi:hypothetical protein
MLRKLTNNFANIQVKVHILKQRAIEETKKIDKRY